MRPRISALEKLVEGEKRRGFEILGVGRTVISCTEELEGRARDLVKEIEKALPEGADPDAALVALAEVALRAQQRKTEKERTKGD